MGIPGESIARRIPGIGTIFSSVSVRAWVVELRAFGIGRLSRALDHEATAVKKLLLETKFLKWARFWHYGRTQISLQMRLFVEQVYSDLGEPWSDLVTGFGPIGRREKPTRRRGVATGTVNLKKLNASNTSRRRSEDRH